MLEYLIAEYMNPRVNLIVPNVSWGLRGLRHECDLLCVSPAGYATEVELKISRSDIKADMGKMHGHRSKLIRRFFFGVPVALVDCEYLPLDAGIIAVDFNRGRHGVKIVRPPRVNKDSRKLTPAEIDKIRHLGCMRIWGLKKKIFAMELNRRK